MPQIQPPPPPTPGKKGKKDSQHLEQNPGMKVTNMQSPTKFLEGKGSLSPSLLGLYSNNTPLSSFGLPQRGLLIDTRDSPRGNSLHRAQDEMLGEPVLAQHGAVIITSLHAETLAWCRGGGTKTAYEVNRKNRDFAPDQAWHYCCSGSSSLTTLTASIMPELQAGHSPSLGFISPPNL